MRFLFFSSMLLIPAMVWAQSTTLPLNFNSSAIKLSVAKDESLALTTRMGEVGLADSMRAPWQRADVGARNGLGVLLDQPNFFNKDTGFVSGFISSTGGKYDIIYHTTNGGLKWHVVNFAQDGWIDDAVNLDNGEAWMTVAGSGIAYSSDFGFSWRKLNNPEPKQRFASIFFNTERHGIIGSLWNMVAYTDNNCETWKLLPTPLDQRKYNKTNKSNRPDFSNVAIYKNFLLVKQEELVFYSKRDSLNWIWLPEYNDFYTDPENSGLFFKTNKGRYLRVDSNLIPLHVFEMQATGYDAKCKNGSLYIVESSRMIQLNNQNETITTFFATTTTPNIQPVNVGYNANGVIGLLNNKVFIQKNFQGAWDYLFTLPFSREKGTLSVIKNGAQLMYDGGDDSLFYFNLSGKLVNSESRTEMIANFSKSGITKIVFSEGSRGCFHSYSNQLIYNNEGGQFGGAVEISSSTMPHNAEAIEESDVLGLLNKLPLIFDPTQKATIKDLAFSRREYDRCKKDILDFQASLKDEKNRKETSFYFDRNNLDFSRLLRLVDSINNIDAETLNSSLFNLGEIWSTTTNWKKVELINARNEVLSIASYYYEPNAFFFPWTVSLNGYTISTTNMEINRFIEKVYPAFLNEGKRVKVLHALVKRLY
jgi:hypothetical protein